MGIYAWTIWYFEDDPTIQIHKWPVRPHVRTGTGQVLNWSVLNDIAEYLAPLPD